MKRTRGYVRLGAWCLATSVGCALPDYEVGSLPGDAATERHGAHDATADDATAHDAAKRHDARGDRGTEEATTPPPTCTSKTYPPPPTGPDVPGVGTFTLAIRSIDLGESDVVPPGYDLDHTCTCIDDGGASCRSPQEHCDKPGGVDNGALGLIQSFELTQPAAFGSVPFSERAEMGAWSLLFQISGYGTSPDGGVADDPNVQVNVFASSGSVAQPMWMGDDAWLVTASSVLDGGIAQPRYTSPGAYVANHVLVAALPEIEITLSGGTMQTITMRLSSGFITGTLDVAAGQMTISDGIISFRWAAPDIFGAISSYRDGSGKAICTDNVVYPVTKSLVCAGLDILVNGADPASLPCNALSTGIGFTAFPILPLSQVGPTTIPSGSCPPATDPVFDSCDAGEPD